MTTTTISSEYKLAYFVKSAGKAVEFPRPHGLECCILGRSNVGKSSFINHALNQPHLAKTAKMPGKTCCANFFKLNETLTWVDLPGYGFARASQSEKERWSRLIADYCSQRENLGGIIWLLDVRHPGLPADLEAYAWLKKLKKPILPVLTKCDTITRGDLHNTQRLFARSFPLFTHFVPFTTKDNQARFSFWKSCDAWFETWQPNE